MSTEINITVGPQSLVDRNRQEVQGNRFSRAEQDAQKRTQAAATDARQQQLAQQGLTADGQAQYGTTQRPNFQRQKPAAWRMVRKYKYATAYLAWGSESRYRLYSCDGLDYIDFTAPFSFRGSYEFFMLPIGGNNAIFVSPKNAAGEISPRAFLIGESTVREIGVPSNLRAIINIPDFYVGVGNWFVGCRFSDIQANSSYLTRASFYGHGPGIYSWLRDPVAADNAVYSQPSYNGTPETFWKREAAAEQFIGLDLLPRDGSLAVSELNPTKALRYTGQYPPSAYSFPPINGTEDPIWRVEDTVLDILMTEGPFLDGQGNPLPPDPFPFWDWGKPDYCRQQLLALGFTAADLIP